MPKQLEIKNLCAGTSGHAILRDFNLLVPRGEVHALMGPNGVGKSTLAKVMAGHPDYTVSSGQILLDGEDITGMAPDKIARRGLFLAFQYPVEIAGVSIANFIRAALNARLEDGGELDAVQFYHRLREKMDLLKMDRKLTARAINEGFSGGEKKRCEILQMAMLEPRYAVLDETDSGLDIDALKVVAEGVNALRGPERGILLITHYQRILDHTKPDRVHVITQGRVIRSGGPGLALEIEEKGYDWLEKNPAPAKPETE